MRRVFALVLVLVFGLSASGRATTLVLPSSEFDQATQRGTVVLLDFWAGWCKPCIDALPWYSDLQAEFKNQGLQVVVVNVDRAGKAPKDVIAGLHEDVIVLLDPVRDFARPYKLHGLPTTIVMDRKGKIRIRYSGFDPSEMAAFKKKLTRLLAEE